MSEKITAVHIERYKARQWAVSDPCFICGGRWRECGHDQNDTEPFIKRIKQMSAQEREAILKGK